MASSMTNVEIEAALRKVLKLQLTEEASPEQPIQAPGKDNTGNIIPTTKNCKLQKNNGVIKKLKDAPLSSTADIAKTLDNQTSLGIKKDGMLSLSEIEDRSPNGKNNNETAPENVSHKKKRQRGKKFKSGDLKNQQFEDLKCETEAFRIKNDRKLVNEKDNEKIIDQPSLQKADIAYDDIFSEKTILSLSNSAVEVTVSAEQTESKKTLTAKLKSPVKQSRTDKTKLISDKSIIDSSIAKLNEALRSGNSSSFAHKLKHDLANDSDYDKRKIYQSSSENFRKPDNAVRALDRLNLAMLDKMPTHALPVEVIFIIEQQYIFPLTKKSSRQPKARYLCRLCEYHCNNLPTCKRHMESPKHLSSMQGKLLISTLKQLPLACEYQLEAINKLLEEVFEGRRLKVDDLKNRCFIVDRLEELFKEKLPDNCKVKLFGSSVSQLGLSGCDVNINISVPTSDGLHPGSILKIVYSVLANHSEEFGEIVADYEAKLPSIYFKHLTSGCNCVIGINNTAALQTSELLRDYASLDERVKVLCVALRYWARICYIDRQQECTLPPHTFDIMVIYCLQRQSPPVLPVLCDVENNQLKQNEIMKNWVVENSMPIAHLWLEMLRFYAIYFPNSGVVISIRTLNPIQTSRKNWRNRVFSIEDPFILSRNLARNISSQNINDFILNCFKFTFKYFGIPQLITGPLFDYIDEPAKTNSISYKEQNCLQVIESIANLTVDETQKLKQPRERSESLDGPTFDSDSDISDTNDIETSDLSPLQKDCENYDNDVQASTSKEDENENPKAADTNSNKDKNMAKPFLALPLSTPPEIIELIKGVKKEDYVYEFQFKTFTGGKRPIIECSVCHKRDHVRKNCPEETLPALCVLPSMNQEFLESISVACKEIHQMLSPTNFECNSRKALLKELQTFIRKFYSDAVVELFGSSCNGFGFKNSDLDICLTFEGNVAGKGINFVDVIMSLAEKFKQMKVFAMVIAIPTAKVPIVKFSHMKTRMECDISLYNTLAKCNTRMLRMYSEIDPRVAVLGFTMKYFAKLCDIGDASRGSLSSYAYTLMVLYFLQQRNPPIIPVLQELCDKGSKPGTNMIDGWNAWYYSKLETLVNPMQSKIMDDVWPYRGKNMESVGELWLNLLKFYTEEFNYKENVISIRQKKILTRFEKLWNSKCIAIEDPFDLNHNLGSGVSNKMSVYIRKAFIRGREVFGNPVQVPNNLVPLTNNLRSMREFLFDPRKLVEGPPPNDRGCRVCGKIGHIVRDCPIKKGRPRKLDSKIKNESDKLEKGRGDFIFKGPPLVAKHQLPINQNQHPTPLGPVTSTFGPMNVMRPPIAWNSIPRPFIQPNLNQRPLPYIGVNTMINRIPGTLNPRPTFASPANVRIIRPHQGNVFVDQRVSSVKENSSFNP